MLTCPVSVGCSCSLSAGIAQWSEHGLPPIRSITPAVGLEYKCALGAVCNHEAVNHMVQLAAVTTALINVTHQLARFTAVWRILSR